MASTRKIQRLEKDKPELNFIIYIAPQRIQKKRLEILTQAAIRKGFSISENFSKNVTHIVTEFDQIDQLEKALNMHDLSEITVVSSKWLTSSIKSGRLLEITSEYKLKELPSVQTQKNINEKPEYITEYACQRVTLLENKNERLVQSLEILAKQHEFHDDDSDYPRALAFRKAAAALKSLPYELRHIDDLENVKDIGKHSKRIIQEILENGFSEEVQEIVQSDWYISMELFTAVFGVGPATANKWFNQGYRSIEDLQQIFLNKKVEPRMCYGLAFYDHLSKTSMTLSQAEEIKKFIYHEANTILPGTTVDIAGGFRRGKKSGHDVDLIISHPEEGAEVKLLEDLHKKLQDNGYLLYSYFNKSTFQEHLLKTETRPFKSGTMDHFAKCFCIFKHGHKKLDLDNISNSDSRLVSTDGDDLDKIEDSSSFSALLQISQSKCKWKACRVDLILTSKCHYAYCMLGWTGNKHFNRSLRDYSKKELNMKLTSHGLWDFNKGKALSASTEREIFDHLQLIYREPWERNC